MDTFLIALGVAVIGGLLTAFTRLVLNRQSARAAAVGPARLVRHELELVIRALEHLVETGQWWRSDLDVPTWEAEKTKLASAMTEEEVMAVHHATIWIGTANSMAPRVTTLGRSRPLDDEQRETFATIRQVVKIADQAILPVAKGKGGLLRRRRSRFSISPDPTADCRCGHRWHEHQWGAKRRWLRFPMMYAPFMDVATGCGACECKRFVAADGAWIPRRALRRFRMLPQTTLPEAIEGSKPVA